MDKRLLDILCCPVSKRPLRPLTATERDQLNGAIRAGAVDTVTGEKVADPITEGLITTDGQLVYRVEDGIPVMLPEAGIGTLQLSGFAPETGRA
ncbi:Trm112 family protein [Luteibacter sp. E-22]|uniref:Trm112 family protein n=1 Tax=Luteibacter sp. E-22 TaxID=3404050 RepID=UPI003CF57A38